MQRVTVGLEDGVAVALASRAAAERRSVASMARVLIEAGLNGEVSVRLMSADRIVGHLVGAEEEAGLGGEEPNGGVGADGALPAVDSSASGSSSPPSPDVFFKPDPKPGKRQ